MIARTALIATDDLHDWDPGIDALKWRNTKHNIINEELSKWLINPFPPSIIVCWESLYELSFKWHFFIFQNHVSTYLQILKYIHQICMFWLCSLLLWHWHSLSLSHLYTTLLSLSVFSRSPQRMCRTLKSGGRRFQDRESLLRAGEHLGNWLPILSTVYCAVCNAPHCTVMHCTRRNTDATRGQLLIWFRGLPGDYIGLFCKDQ